MIFLKPDMSFIEREVKTHQNFLVLGRDDYVQFSYGKSVFKERLKKSDKLLKFWKKPRNIAIAYEGSNKAFEVHYDEPEIKEGDPDAENKIKLKLSIWNKKEANEYAKKQFAKQSSAKMITGWQFFALFAVGLATLLFLVLRFF